MKKKNPVIHFEMPSKDSERIKKFYREAFGWDSKPMGKEFGDYVMTITTDSDEKGMPIRPGTINGGFYPIKEDMPPQYPVIVIRVDNMEKAVKDLEKAGGSVKVKPMDIPTIGKYASFFDTEGNLVGLLEPTPEMKKKQPKTVETVKVSPPPDKAFQVNSKKPL